MKYPQFSNTKPPLVLVEPAYPDLASSWGGLGGKVHTRGQPVPSVCRGSLFWGTRLNCHYHPGGQESTRDIPGVLGRFPAASVEAQPAESAALCLKLLLAVVCTSLPENLIAVLVAASPGLSIPAPARGLLVNQEQRGQERVVWSGGGRAGYSHPACVGSFQPRPIPVQTAPRSTVMASPGGASFQGRSSVSRSSRLSPWLLVSLTPSPQPR